MFENATIICPIARDGNFDIARLLDAMLYYKRIEFIVDARSFGHLWRTLGSDGFRDLLTHPSIDAKITSEMPAVKNETINGVTTHQPVFISMSGRDGLIFDHKDTASALAFMIKEEDFRANKTIVKRIIREVGDTRFNKIFNGMPDKDSLFWSLVEDVESFRMFIRVYALKNGLQIDENALANLAVELHRLPNGVMIGSNIPASAVIVGGGQDGWNQLLPMAHDYQLDLLLSQRRSADLICSEMNAQISSARLDLSINRALDSEQRQTAFERSAFGEARIFGEAFRDGVIDLKTALDIIDKTAKFREWLSGLPVDRQLIEEYHKAISRETILDKFGGRSARFAFFTGSGAVMDIFATGGLGTVAAMGLSAFDAFVLDGLVRGWRPNNFVEKVENAVQVKK